jgi:tartrate dehydrogenase/decarboxylase/D-malate dehydrogenase
MHRIAVIPGDGIGNEVVPMALEVFDAAGERFGFSFEWTHFPWGCEYFLEHGEMMPANGVEILSEFESVFLGAVGAPGVDDHVSLWGLLIPIRRGFDQYVNFRPVRLLKGVTPPLRDKIPEDIDFVVVRENTEGEYSDVGGRIFEGTEREAAMQDAIFTRFGVERIMRYAFELARSRPAKHLTSATKSNGIVFTMPFWDQIFREVAEEFDDVRADQEHIDALAAKMVLAPQQFDVIVGSNLFGDILSDLGPALAGSLGIAASANLDPEKRYPSLFEPVHGSAPDIFGQGIANPVGTIWSGALMIEHLGHPEAAQAIVAAFETVIGDRGICTPDLGGTANTEEMGRAIVEEVRG